jgi:hypothetical protein
VAFAEEKYREYLRAMYVDNEGDQYDETYPDNGFSIISRLDNFVGGDFVQRARLAALVLQWSIAEPNVDRGRGAGWEQWVPIAEWYFDQLWERGEHPYNDSFEEMIAGYYEGSTDQLEAEMKEAAERAAHDRWCQEQVERRGEALAFAPETLTCHACGGEHEVTGLGPTVNVPADPTQSYRLECGHTAI